MIGSQLLISSDATPGSHHRSRTSGRVSRQSGVRHRDKLTCPFFDAPSHRHHHGLPDHALDVSRHDVRLGDLVAAVQASWMGTGTGVELDRWCERVDRGSPRCLATAHVKLTGVHLSHQLWVALAIMIAESVISLVPIILSYARKIRRSAATSSRRPSLFYDNRSRPSSRKSSRLSTIDEEDSLVEVSSIASDASEEELEPPSRLVPTSWVLSGLGASAVLGVGLVWRIFGADGIHPWATAVGLVLASILSLLGVRALGETDLNPVSGIGKISQLLFAVLQPGNVVANIIAGGVAEAGAQQAGDLMQDLKTGALLGASPRSQFYGQMIGSLASVFVSSAAYKLYTKVYTIPGPEFRVPTAAIWLNLARLLNTGELPPRAAHFMVIFGALFGLLSAAKYILPLWKSRPPRWLRYLPSGIAFAIGFLNTPSFSLARLIGGYVAYRTSQRTGQTPLLVIVCASGFVLGEGVISVVGLVLASAGLGAVSCAGCHVGGGGYCAGGC